VPTAIAVKVVDASALAALLFGEPEADTIAAQLDGAQMAAPALLDDTKAVLGHRRRGTWRPPGGAPKQGLAVVPIST